MPTRRQESAAAREADILQAARQVFARKGYGETRIQDVAEASGIAKGTVYLYFRSKEELYWALVRRDFEELQRRSREALLAHQGAAAKLRAFLATRLRFFAEQGDFFRIYFGEMGQALIRHGPALERFQDLYLAQVATLRGIVEEGIAAGELRAVKAETTALAILDLVRSRVAHRLQGSSASGAEEELEELFAFIWRGIGR
jgi:AcrR family transcriptional regulator